jgi:hypothetical protein
MHVFGVRCRPENTALIALVSAVGAHESTLVASNAAAVKFRAPLHPLIPHSSILRTHSYTHTYTRLPFRLLLYWETCYHDPATNSVPRQEYIELHLRMAKAMLPEFDFDAATHMAAQEWDNDSLGAAVMNETLFLNAMWTLVDMWTSCVHLDCYCWFLDTLYDCLTVPRVPFSRLMDGERPVFGVKGGAAGLHAGERRWRNLDEIPEDTAAKFGVSKPTPMDPDVC